MHELDLTRELSIEVAYVDEHVVELAAVVEAGHWRECATAYTVSAEVAQFAEALLRFADGGPSATFAAGAGTGVGLVALGSTASTAPLPHEWMRAGTAEDRQSPHAGSHQRRQSNAITSPK
jgi:hypothetical protein